MRKIEIVYDTYAERVLNSDWECVPQELERIVSLAHCIQNMCVGNGKNWDRACPKWLRGVLNKDATIGAFRRASRLLAIVVLNPMFIASGTLRFFKRSRDEDSFYEVTVNLNRAIIRTRSFNLSFSTTWRCLCAKPARPKVHMTVSLDGRIRLATAR